MRCALRYTLIIVIICILIISCLWIFSSSKSEASRAGLLTLSANNPSIARAGASEVIRVEHAYIYSAQYLGGEGTGRRNVRILGRNFNTAIANENDCLESTNGVAWTPCASLIFASASEYDIVAIHSADWPRVYVKVRGQDGLFSDPVPIQK